MTPIKSLSLIVSGILRRRLLPSSRSQAARKRTTRFSPYGCNGRVSGPSCGAFLARNSIALFSLRTVREKSVAEYLRVAKEYNVSTNFVLVVDKRALIEYLEGSGEGQGKIDQSKLTLASSAGTTGSVSLHLSHASLANPTRPCFVLPGCRRGVQSLQRSSRWRLPCEGRSRFVPARLSWMPRARCVRIGRS